jgi:beta-glucanase (GH16 family)
MSLFDRAILRDSVRRILGGRARRHVAIVSLLAAAALIAPYAGSGTADAGQIQAEASPDGATQMDSLGGSKSSPYPTTSDRWRPWRSNATRTAVPTVTKTPAAAPVSTSTATSLPATPTPAPASTNTPAPAATDTPTAAATSVTRPGYRLVFDEEFSGSGIDTSKWNTQLRWGSVNPPELEYYAPDAFSFANGVLSIKAEKRSMGGKSYTSGVIASFGKYQFTYGYAEMRARMPKGQGLWPAFWLLAANQSSYNEIDTLEILGNEPAKNYMSLHYNSPTGPLSETHSWTGPDFSADFHTFAVDWSPTALVWYVDGVQRSTITHDVPAEPMYLLANLAVGGVWPGNPDGTTVIPATLDVDYIRVFQH